MGEWHYSRSFATSSVRTAMHCKSFRDDDILKNSSVVLYSLRTCSRTQCLRQHMCGGTSEDNFTDTKVFCMLLSFANIAKKVAG